MWATVCFFDQAADFSTMDEYINFEKEKPSKDSHRRRACSMEKPVVAQSGFSPFIVLQGILSIKHPPFIPANAL